MKKRSVCLSFLTIILFFFQIPPTLGFYTETTTLVSNGNSDYFYTLDTPSIWYIEEANYLDISIVVDFFDYDSLEIYDIELFVAGEDVDGITWFEDGSGILSENLLFDGDELVVEFDIIPASDWPVTLYLFVTGEFSEDTSFGIYDTLDYSDDYWFEMGSVQINERRASRAPGLGILTMGVSLGVIVLIRIKPTKSPSQITCKIN